jgi:hypothetical protein
MGQDWYQRVSPPLLTCPHPGYVIETSAGGVIGLGLPTTDAPQLDWPKRLDGRHERF